MNYRMVIFDFDGTLADTFGWFMSAVNKAADKYHFRRVETSQMELLRGCGPVELMRRLEVSRWKTPWIARYMRQLQAAEVRHFRLFDGVEPLLRGLREQGVILGIASSNAMANVTCVLGAELSALVGYWGCSASIMGKAPVLRRIVRKSGMNPAEILFVGDELRDAEAARGAMMPFGAVTYGYNNAAVMQSTGAALVFSSVREMRRELLGF